MAGISSQRWRARRRKSRARCSGESPVPAGARSQRAVRDGAWKLVIDQGRPLLFDLSKDPGERTDLVGRHPEIATRLKAALDAWMADVDAGAAPPPGP